MPRRGRGVTIFCPCFSIRFEKSQYNMDKHGKKYGLTRTILEKKWKTSSSLILIGII